jgi:hypothetical protein
MIRLLIGVVLAVLVALGGWLGISHYGAERYDAGYSAAVAAGKEARDSAAVAHLAIESGLRTQLLDRDTAALRKEQEYASNLADAQRRVRAGTDRLRCPTGSVPAAPAPAGRSAAGGPAVDGGGADLVPEAAADVLGDSCRTRAEVRPPHPAIRSLPGCEREAMMDFHVITSSGSYLVMATQNGQIIQVWPAPPESLPTTRPADASLPG